MSTITDFAVVGEDGFPVAADPHGNNVAFRCIGCGGPVLAVARENQRGSSTENPAVCRGCHSRYWIEVREQESTVVLHRVRAVRSG
jgi:uncharacterized protein with PIN domain